MEEAHVHNDSRAQSVFSYFGRTHQEVDMAGSFYEIMRCLSQDPLLPHIVDLRKIINDLLGLVPQDQRQLAIKRHPLIVMNYCTSAPK